MKDVMCPVKTRPIVCCKCVLRVATVQHVFKVDLSLIPVATVPQSSNIFANVGHRLRMHHVNLVLHGARVPAYAIPNAVDMLTTGTYTRIPTKIKALAPSDTPGDGEVRGAMRWLDQHIGSRLIDMHLPHVISTSVVRRGRLWLTETGLYEVRCDWRASGRIPWECVLAFCVQIDPIRYSFSL